MPDGDGFDVRSESLHQGARKARDAEQALERSRATQEEAVSGAVAGSGGGDLAGALGELGTSIDTASVALGGALEGTASAIDASAQTYLSTDGQARAALDGTVPEGQAP